MYVSVLTAVAVFAISGSLLAEEQVAGTTEKSTISDPSLKMKKIKKAKAIPTSELEQKSETATIPGPDAKSRVVTPEEKGGIVGPCD